jgi:pimeloyl-ACP methyl ester carboxylesterase
MQSACRLWWGLAAVVGLALILPLRICAAENSTSGGYAELPGVKLWFTDTGGTGTPIVLLHANTGTSVSWESQAVAFAREGYRVIAFDRRGWGKSLANPATGPQPGSVAADLDALVDHLKLDKFHLVGVAGGGFVSLDYAAWRPERLRSRGGREHRTIC